MKQRVGRWGIWQSVTESLFSPEGLEWGIGIRAPCGGSACATEKGERDECSNNGNGLTGACGRNGGGDFRSFELGRGAERRGAGDTAERIELQSRKPGLRLRWRWERQVSCIIQKKARAGKT